MAIYLTFSPLLTTLIILASSAGTSSAIPLRNQDLQTAIEEMQRANYFTFVVLINMVPATLIPGNVTLLMPKDRVLAKTLMPVNDVGGFLQRHSIPSPLLFDHLLHIPTGSIIPTEEPGFALEVSNEGRRSFYLNNVRIISPNICTAGSSIRCHGIDGVVQPAGYNTTLLPPPPCLNVSSTTTSPARSPPPPPPPPRWPSPAPPVAPPPGNSQNGSPNKSGSSQLLPFGGLMSCLNAVLLTRNYFK